MTTPLDTEVGEFDAVKVQRCLLIGWKRDQDASLTELKYQLYVVFCPFVWCRLIHWECRRGDLRFVCVHIVS